MPDAAAPPLFSPREVRAIVLGLTLSLFLSSLDQTIVATALSAIAGDLGGRDLLPWVVSAYLIASTVTTPIYGRLSDLYGRRPLLLASVALFVAGSALCALAPDMLTLILARVAQGLGGGGLRALSLAVVGDILPPRERAKVQGYLSATFATANVMGPVLGGLAVEYLTWHWIFWVNLPLGAAAFAATWFQLRRLPRPGGRPQIDWLGALLIVLSCTPVLLGITFVQRAGSWAAPEALGCFALGAVVFVALIAQERAVAQPMLPLHLFRNRVFAMAVLATGVANAVMTALTILLPWHYQAVAGLSAKDSGLRLIAMTLGTVTGSFLAGQLVARSGRYRPVLLAGAAIAVAMCGVLAVVELGHSLALDTAVTALLGLGFGCQFSPITITVQNAVEPRDGGIAVACMMFVRLLGGAFGVALLSSVLLGRLPAGVAGAAAAPAFAAAYWLAGGIAVLGLLATAALREIPLRGR